jgi:hypothetical protein
MGVGHLDEERLGCWIEPPQQSDKISLGHRGAAGGGRGGIFPDVHEDTRARARRCRGIVGDENSPFVEIVGAPHLFGAAPIDSSDFRTIDQLVVIMRAGIIDSLGHFGERDVVELDPTRPRRGCVTECRAEAKNSRGHFVVAFDLAWAGASSRIDQSQAPAQPALSQHDRNSVTPHFPIAGGARPREGLESAGRRTPIRRQDHNALTRISQRIRSGRCGLRDHRQKQRNRNESHATYTTYCIIHVAGKVQLLASASEPH